MDKGIVKIPQLPSLTEKHTNKWVALSPDYTKIIAVGETLPDVLKQTSDQNKKVIFKVLPKLGYAPFVF